MATPTPTNNFKIIPRLNGFTRYSELKFSNLYLYHTYSGPNQTQATIIGNNNATELGKACVNNWPIYEGLGSDAQVVARAQGLHIYAGNWHCNFSISFENERFNGSTLEVQGVPVEEGEWAIVGGTGEFKMATGVIYKKVHERNNDGNIIELRVHGFCPVPLKPYKDGPWGPPNLDSLGEPFDLEVTPLRLVDTITIRHGGIVDAIEFSYIDEDGEKQNSGLKGGATGRADTVTLGASEYVKQISGRIGSLHGEACISPITFVTNIRSYGPFGKGDNTTGNFSVSAEDGYNIAGFFGRARRWLNGVGVHMHPL